MDVDENSDLSNEESVAKVDRNTAEVRGYEEFSVSENDDQMNIKVYVDILDDEVKNCVVVQDDFKVILENPNEFFEVKVERNVVKLLFETYLYDILFFSFFSEYIFLVTL